MSQSNAPLHLTVEPGGLTVTFAPSTPLADVLHAAGVDFAYPCGGAHLCGRCRVVFRRGAPAPTEEEKRILAFGDIEAGVRLACCVTLDSDAVVELPAGRAEMHTEHILTQGVRSDVVVDPEVQRYRGVPAPSTLETPVSDWLRIVAALPESERAAARPTLDVLQRLPAVMACSDQSGECVTLTMRAHRVLKIECGDTTERLYGVAVDLGTTTISAVLVDMRTGAELAVSGCLNPQRSFGYDLISRIHAVQDSFANLDRLHIAVIEAIGGLIERMCTERDIPTREVVALTLAGNTLMSHLFLNIDPTSLGHAPFAGTLRAGVRCEARDLGLPIHDHAPVCILPCIGGFVGGDITAGILVTRLMDQPGVSVLVDIGTNGEVVVARDGVLMATSSAAGPAFEGGKIRCGMMAAHGAVHRVEFDGQDLRVQTLGDRPACGVCGSGLIESFARLYETGLIAMNGRMARPGGPETAALPPALAARLVAGEDGPAVVLVPAENGREAIVITQADVREFQLGKGAVQTAILMVLETMGIALDQIDRFLVAGAFGNHLNVADAMALGLLPELPAERVFFIGNSSLEGARCALLNRYERQRAERIAETTGFVELATCPEFQDRFAMSMMLGPAMF